MLGTIFGGLSGAGGWFIGVDFLHQGLMAIGGSIVLAAYIFAYSHFTKSKPLLIFSTITVVGLMVQAILGQSIYWGWGISGLVGLHYSLSVIILTATAASASLIFIADKPLSEQTLRYPTRFSRQAGWLVGLVLIVLVSGVWLASSGTSGLCDGWPLCNQGLFSVEALIPLGHRALVGIVGIFLLRFALDAWKRQRTQRLILTTANSMALLYIAQGFIGAMGVVGKYSPALIVLHEITASVLVIVSVILVVSLGIRQRTEEEELADSKLALDRVQRFKDFIALNKPIVVSLLLATTLGGMIIGYHGFPPLGITIVTLISGALAAGGSGAINQFIDQDIDSQMSRTSKRPIPSGRLTPAEGLAFGVSALIISFYLMAGLVNMLAAILTLIGMVYYVYLYSIVLKRRSVQNIVIGGGAGAIPPMVGWAAATGSLDLTAGFLFLIIFLWTPPHFWALALTRKNEYATAGVPMMPVARGEDATRKMIFSYTLILIGVTISMWFLGLAGWVYLIGAVLLGAYLIWLAWQVWKEGRNRVYYRMYRHSNYYLLLLFVVLAVDSML